MFDFNRLLFVPYESLGRMYSLKIRKKKWIPRLPGGHFFDHPNFCKQTFFFCLALDPNTTV